MRKPLPISKRRERMSWCGRRSPARWSTGPRRSAASRDPLAAPAVAPIATWSATITVALRSRWARGGLTPPVECRDNMRASSGLEPKPDPAANGLCRLAGERDEL